MSEKTEARFNEIDMQAVIAAWIISNDKCGVLVGVDCAGKIGLFKGTECPLFGQPGGCGSNKSIINELKEWLSKYHYKKAMSAAEIEKRKTKPSKKNEREEKKTCGECQHIYDADGSVEIGDSRTTLCHIKSIRVPIDFIGCRDFEPRATGKMTLQSQNSASESAGDAIIYNGILISTPSQEDKLRHKVWLLELENDHKLNDIERLKAEAAKRTAEDAERISQLEKDNARLAFSVHCHEKKMELAVEICESGECDAKKDRVYLTARCERLTEQRNRLSNSLIEEKRRAKEVERENSALHERISAMLSDLLYFQWKAETGQLMPFSVLNDIEGCLKRIRQSWASRQK